MKHKFCTGLILIFMIALIFCGCSPGGWGNGNSCPEGAIDGARIVSASTGNDGTADGSCSRPYKTVTAALATMSGGTVWVAPGTYDTTLGEVFPITLPAGVSLIGDEANKGQGTTPTKIIDGTASIIDPGAGSVIAGFEITSGGGAGLFIDNNNITLRNNSLVNNVSHAVFFFSGSVNHIITGNTISNNGGGGLTFAGGSGTGSMVENNIITNNEFGIEYDSPGGNIDLGGGSAGSAGGNTISCNVKVDLWTNAGITIDAQNNFWDHNPPTVFTGSWDGVGGYDIYNMGSSTTIVTTNAGVAANNCP